MATELMIQQTLYMYPELIADLKELAEVENMNLSEFVRVNMKEIIERKYKSARKITIKVRGDERERLQGIADTHGITVEQYISNKLPSLTN